MTVTTHSRKTDARDSAGEQAGSSPQTQPGLHEFRLPRVFLPVARPTPRRFWIGNVPVAVGAFLSLIAPAFADPQPMADVYTWPVMLAGDQAYVKIDEPEQPGAVATVTFHDVPIHGEDKTLTLHGAVPVQIEFIWRGGSADTVRVTPPAGYVALPAEITPGEGETGKAHIFLYLGG